MTIGRRTLLTAAALMGAAFGSGCAKAVPSRARYAEAQLLARDDYDRARMLRALDVPGSHKQVFQIEKITIENHAAHGYTKMQNSLNAFAFSLGLGDLRTLGVLMGSASLLALDDAMWKRYALSEVYDVRDAAGLRPDWNHFHHAAPTARRGPSVATSREPCGNTGASLLDHGASLMVCNHSLAAAAWYVAAERGAPDGFAVYREFRRHVLPSIVLVPAGVAVVQIAQEFGWKPYAA